MNKKDDSDKILAEFSSRPRFYSVFLVTSLAKTVEFYCDILGCRLIHLAATEVEIDFFGNHVCGQLVKKPLSSEHPENRRPSNHPSFGLVMSSADWHRAVDHMNYIGVKFFLEPTVESDSTGEEHALFLLEDPSGNILEFKSGAS
jgi:extradiol dioxygenase family protein